MKVEKKLAKETGATEKFVRKQLQMGKKVEKEHTDSPKKAKKIAKEHVKERPDYYSMLKKAEKTPVKRK
jgi:hypothetical protein